MYSSWIDERKDRMLTPRSERLAQLSAPFWPWWRYFLRARPQKEKEEGAEEAEAEAEVEERGEEGGEGEGGEEGEEEGVEEVGGSEAGGA